MFALFAFSLVASVAFAAAIDTLTPGRWYAFPNSTLKTVGPNPVPAGSTGVASVMDAWSGGVYDTDRDQLVVWGGGHTNYAGNEVYAFGPLSSDSASWRRLTNPSTPPAENTAHATDGRPVSRHTYNLLAYLPAPYNKMASCAIGSQYSNGYSAASLDFYDFTIDGYSGQPWSQGPSAPSNQYATSAFCAYNPITARLWYQDNSSNQSRLQEYNPASNAWKSHVVFNPNLNMTPAIDTKRNLMVAVGGRTVYVYNLNSPDGNPVAATTAGPTDVQGGNFPGFIYDPVNDQFVGWNGGAALLALVIPSGAPSGTWTWTPITLDPANTVSPGAANTTGTYGRFRYVPAHQGVIVVNAVDQNVYFLKLPNNGGKPLPAVNISANPTSVPDQGTTTITWSTTNAASCVASGAWSGTKPVSGSEARGPLSANSTFTLTCDNGAGGTNSGSATVQVASATPAPTVSLSANPTSVAANGTSQLMWTTVNASSCTASGAWSGNEPTSGSLSVGPLTADATYTLTCTGAGGTAASTVTVTLVASPTPVVNVSATPSSVPSGTDSTLTWVATNATSCTASSGWSGLQPTSGSQLVGPLMADTSFILTCTGGGGTSQGSATVRVTTSATSGSVNHSGGGAVDVLTLLTLLSLLAAPRLSAWRQHGATGALPHRP